MSQDFESRLASVEAKVAERDDPRLVQGVERLGDETAGLNEILSRVNQQQQSLTALGERVETKASHVNLRLSENAERHARVRAAYWTAAGLTALGLLLGGIVAFTINSDYHACVQRQERVDIQVAFYRDVSIDTPPQSFIKQRALEAADDLAATKVDCDALYPVHWGDSAYGLEDP